MKGAYSDCLKCCGHGCPECCAPKDEYAVLYTRDRGLWMATVQGVVGVHTQGRSRDEARDRVREALALAIGDEAAEKVRLVEVGP